MSSKKGYFFTMDAIIGFTVLFIGLMLYLTVPPTQINYREFEFADEIRSYFNNKLDSIDVRGSKIGDYVNYCFYDDLLMCNLNNRIDQQILILYAKELINDEIKGNASKFSKAVLETIFKNQFVGANAGNFSILSCAEPFINAPLVLFNTSDSSTVYSEIAPIRWVVSASEGNKHYGPCVFEVQVWK
ncbi:MAG TPA: hypothetical protein PLX15_04020 [Candidatus Woesearchaeota archaeon]|nr:hypothetical protein [Candidatus Woesearchaeota archaeon]